MENAVQVQPTSLENSVTNALNKPRLKIFQILITEALEQVIHFHGSEIQTIENGEESACHPGSHYFDSPPIFSVQGGLGAKSWPALSNTKGYRPPGSSVHGILQEKILEWTAISFSRVSSPPRDWAWVSCIARRFFTNWATMEVRVTF